MAKGTRGRRGSASRRRTLTPYPLPSHTETESTHQNNSPKILDHKDWEDATCSVCMECPHNAVLLLCSSHDKGCRPYMCGTSLRHSNCLEQYEKAHTQKTIPSSGNRNLLACPLCRGPVKGWTVVGPARDHLNAKKRNCTHDNCSFNGTYKELSKHVRTEHGSSTPREVDPNLEQKWRSLEREREAEDVRSTIRSAVPGAVFFGDYVVEGGHFGNYSEDEGGIDMSVFLLLQAFRSARNMGTDRDDIRLDSEGDEDDPGFDMSLAGRLRRQGGPVLGRSGRRRNRGANRL